MLEDCETLRAAGCPQAQLVCRTHERCLLIAGAWCASGGKQKLFHTTARWVVLPRGPERQLQWSVVVHCTSHRRCPASQWEEAGEVPRDLWKSAGENGLLCVTMPEEMGGSAADALHAAITWEEQSYTGCTGPGFALHSEIVAPYLLHYGTDEQKAQYLPRMASGDCITAIAMTEPGAGSDLQGIRTTAVQDGDDWILNGSKTFITNGWLCDMVIVVAKTDASAEKAAHGISLFLVDAGTAGFNKGSKLKKLGMKAQDTAELFFDNVRLPSSAILGGKPNQGFYQLMQELQQERLMIADMGVAGSEAAFECELAWRHAQQARGLQLSLSAPFFPQGPGSTSLSARRSASH